LLCLPGFDHPLPPGFLSQTARAQYWRLAAFLLFGPLPLRMHLGRSCCSVWSRSSRPYVDVGGAELVGMAIEGIGAAAHVPADAEGNRTAIGSAIFAAVGARPRHLPIRPEAVRQALAAKT
jgi:hypothetical protein